MTHGVTLMTARELFELCDEPYQHELIDGKLHRMEPPGLEHVAVAMEIGSLLAVHARTNQLGFGFAGEVGFVLATDPDTVRAPDAGFIAAARLEKTGFLKGYFPGPPDLAVEVVSPNDRRSKVEGKALDWLAAGTRAVVVLDPDLRTATVYRARDDIRVLAGDEPLDLGDVVPGFSARTGALFVS